MESQQLDAVSVVGLGKLGACTAAAFASRGLRTVGMDIDPALVAAINDGRAPVYESGLQELLREARPHLRGTSHYADVVAGTDVTFLIVPTPSEPDGQFSDRYLAEAIDGLARALRETSKPYHLFVITSTVSPGATEQRLIPLLERVSGRALHQDFGVCYNPAFIALGSVIRDFLNPDLVLIGESDNRAGDIVEAVHRKVCLNAPAVARMSILSAEITKISLNAYVTMKISFANTLAEICEALPGADVDAITTALGADRRIAPYGLRGGPPYGGPCFPRDNRAFAAFAAANGVDALLARGTDELNQRQVHRVIDLVVRQLDQLPDRKVGILGLAYKPNTPVIEESAATAIIDRLLTDGVDVVVYDPLANEAARSVYGERLRYASSARECVASASLLVVTVPWPEFSAIDATYPSHNPTVFVDCWRILDAAKLGPGVQYVALGVAHD